MAQGYTIKYVAIYIRKSRGDEEKDLEGHRRELISICEENEWTYVEYAEVGTSDSIELRPKMKELLSDVEQEMFDAVVCIHLDRLSRGDSVDQAVIQRTFAKAEIVVVTPQKVYDYNNDQDMLLAEFQGMVARLEYKEISRRFRQGKARRAKQGFWSNGVPPFPYKRNPETCKAEPDPVNLPIYNIMKERALNGYVSTDIAWELNKMGIESPRGGLWQPEVVKKILIDETHLGKMIVGKKRKHTTTGELVLKPKVEWIIYNNCHEATKTQEEHDKILFLFTRNQNTPKASRSGKNLFSGILYCDICNHSMRFQKWKNRPYDSIKSCTHYDAFGVRCNNIGGAVPDLLRVVLASIERKRNQIEKAIEEGLDSDQITNLNFLSEEKLKEVREQEKIIDRIFRNHEKKIYSKDEDKNDEIFMQRRDIAEQELQQKIDEYNIIKKQVQNSLSSRNEDLLISIKEVQSMLTDESVETKDKNRALKSILHSVKWGKSSFEDNPKVTVNFL